MLPQEFMQVLLEGSLAMWLRTQELIHSKGSIADIMEKCCYLIHKLSLNSLSVHDLGPSFCLGKYAAHSGLKLLYLITGRKIPHRHSHRQIWFWKFFSWDSLVGRTKAMSNWQMKLSGTGFSCPVCSLFCNCMQGCAFLTSGIITFSIFICFSKATPLLLSFLLIL